MTKVHFYYYQSSPRIHICHVEKMNIVPELGDTIGVINSEFVALNKEIKRKNHFIEFKVAKRTFRMIHKSTFFCDVRIKLEILTNLK